MDARACNTRLVRRLFAQHAPVLSGLLPEILDAYHAEHGSPMLDDALTAQVREFARSSPELPIACEEFLGLIEDIRGAPIDRSDASMSHSDSYQSVLSTRTDATGDTTPSFDDGDNSLRIKLARSAAALERLQLEYEALAEQKRSREAQLEEHVSALRRRVADANAQKERLAERAAELEPHIAAMEESLAKNHEAARVLAEEHRIRSDEIDRLQARCEEYANEATSLRATTSAQAVMITRLEETVILLENALEAAERVQSERDAYLCMSEALELERSVAQVDMFDPDTSSELASWPDVPETLADALRGHVPLSGSGVERTVASVQAVQTYSSRGVQTAPAGGVSIGTQAGYCTSIGTQTEKHTAQASVQAAAVQSHAAVQACSSYVSAAAQTEPRVSIGTQAGQTPNVVSVGTQAKPAVGSAAVQTELQGVSVSVGTQAKPAVADAHAQTAPNAHT
ncbi:hypothetical protein MCUN1_002473 [Malassezia cuniculi]|uniref:Uncharacterized protein n=1 Tax=Malassezia cuniculi TaxID=948313 RepID=A0AAF0EV42_9BASI|nr:hypothetical protein MCUN1_002473 [Malassezia cuniculi]